MALMGDAAAAQYMMGREFAKDFLFIRRLGTDIFPERLIRDDFGEGFINSLELAQNDLGAWYLQFADGQKMYIANLSDAMLKNFETMGLDLYPLFYQELPKIEEEEEVHLEAPNFGAFKDGLTSEMTYANEWKQAMEESLKVSLPAIVTYGGYLPFFDY